MKVPNVSKRAFWEFDFDTIKWDKYAQFLLIRTFERGSFQDILNLISFYGDERTIRELTQAESLSENVYYLSKAIFKLDKSDFKCTNIKPMLTKNNILSYLKENKGYLKRRYFLDKIGLVGSFARGDNNENSDIDLIVYFNKEAKENRIYRLYTSLQEELQSQFKRKVDIIANGKVLPAFKEKVEQEAIYV